MIKDWLRLFRSQTYPATLLLIMSLFLINGDLFSWMGLAVAVFALAGHYLSFGHNSLMDTQGGFDTKDSSKGHHPLVEGEISLKRAHNVIHPLLFGTAVFGIVLSLVAEAPVMALASLILFMAGGYWYNCGFSKTSIWAWIPISICFTSLAAFGYFLESQAINTIFILILGYIFLRIWFQISYSGRLKELEGDFEANELRRMGARVKKRLGYEWFFPGWANLYGWALTLAELGVGIVLFYRFFSWYALPFFAIFAFLGLLFTKKLMGKEWNRSEKLLQMSLVEICWIYLLPMALAPVLGYIEVLVLLVFGVLYFFGINLAIWDTPYPSV